MEVIKLFFNWNCFALNESATLDVCKYIDISIYLVSSQIQADNSPSTRLQSLTASFKHEEQINIWKEQQHVMYLTNPIGDGEEEDEQYADHGAALAPTLSP
jgi:hypothetical protein